MTTVLELQFDITVNDTVSLPFQGSCSWVSGSIKWGTDNVVDTSGVFTFTQTGLYTVTVPVPTSGIITGFGKTSWVGADKLISVKSWNFDTNFINLSHAFSGCTKLESVPSSLPSSVIKLINTFENASSFNQNINSWDISSWNTESASNWNNMFNGASSFTQDTTKWISWNNIINTVLNYNKLNNIFNTYSESVSQFGILPALTKTSVLTVTGINILCTRLILFSSAMFQIDIMNNENIITREHYKLSQAEYTSWKNSPIGDTYIVNLINEYVKNLYK